MRAFSIACLERTPNLQHFRNDMTDSIRSSEAAAERTMQEREPLPRSITSRELMGAARVLIIRHGKDHYRLQLTTTGKLILTK